MAQRDRVSEIAEKKRRGPKAARSYHREFQNLQKLWRRIQAANSDTDDFFLVRAVTLLEVFSRDCLAHLIDHGSPYAERAVDLKMDLKIDLGFVRAIQGRVITMGDMIAHSVSISTFAHVSSVFKTILGKDLVGMISPAKRKHAAWDRQEAAEQIITDAASISSRLSRLFEIRNILCHEFRQEEVYDRKEITAFLAAAEQFAAATSVTLDHLLYGEVPETLEGQIEAAKRELEEGEGLLAEVYGRLDGDGDQKHSRLLSKSQRAWDVFREAQCAFRADGARGGGAAGLLRVLEADNLTQQRIDSLRRFLPEVEDSG
jgi:uncharacterized protein YecT (DUF1311 family)